MHNKIFYLFFAPEQVAILNGCSLYTHTYIGLYMYTQNKQRVSELQNIM